MRWGLARAASRPRVPSFPLRITGAVAVALAVLALAPSVRADPCEGRLPDRVGERFSGAVRYVGDGDSLCVGDGADPRTWIEVRLADHDAPELDEPGGRAAQTALSRLTLGRHLDCQAVRGRNGRVLSWDRVIARCRLDGRALGPLLRRQ